MAPITPAARKALNMTTAYSQVGELLVENGYAAIPVMPNSKFPGTMHFKEWHAMSGWTRYADRLPTYLETGRWSVWPDAGVCVVLDDTVKAVDIDTDDAAITDAILKALPPSQIRKRGAIGFTLFYRGSPSIESRSFSFGGQRVVDLLARGKQTVLPPTIHPTTGNPYLWEGHETLLNTRSDELPELPDDVVERLSDALEPFGYIPSDSKDVRYGEPNRSRGSLNDIALERLGDWVPALHLPRTLPTAGGYRAVASFRPSNSGRPDHLRNRNLSFHRDGIVDFGDDDQGYTAVDVVTAALGLPFYDAHDWLRDRLGLGLPKIDIRKLVENMKRRQAEQAQLAGAPVVGADDEASEVESANDNDVVDEREIPAIFAVAPPAMDSNPFHIDAPGGLMSSVARWIVSTSMTPIAEFSIFAALALMAGLFGRRCVGPTGAALNLYLITLAPTGFGKNRPPAAIDEIATAIGQPSLVVAGKSTGDTALLNVLRAKPSRIMIWDEFGMILQSITGKHATSASSTLRDALIEVYSKSTGKTDGKQFASVERAVQSTPIWCPTLTLVGMSTLTEFYAGLTQASQSDGLLNRLSIVAVEEQPIDQDAPPLPEVPDELISAIKDALEAFPTPEGNLVGASQNIADMRPRLHAIPWANDSAKAAWESVRAWQRAVVARDEAIGGIVQRAAEQTIKLATIRAISLNPAAPAVTDADVSWGWALVHRSILTLHKGIERHMSSSEFERLVKATHALIQDKGVGGVPHSWLLKKPVISAADDRQFEAAIRRLEAAGDIRRVVTRGRGGVEGRRYFAIPRSIAA